MIPWVVLSEAISGRPTDASVNQIVRRLGTADTSAPTARHAGHLRASAHEAGARRIPSGIDAIVAAHASEARAAVVFTTDPRDLRRLLANHPHVAVERP